MKHIYLHGLGQTFDSWNRVIETCGGGKNEICLDLTSLVEGRDVTYHDLFRSFSAVCDATEEQLCLCGLSLGGVLALHYAIEHPQKVGALVLIAAQFKMPAKLLRFQNAIFRFMPKSMFAQTGFRKTDFLMLCSTMIHMDFSDSLQKITCPTIVICGEKDRANRNASMVLADVLPNAELQILKGIGHEVNTEAPEKLAEILNVFYRHIQ